MVNQIGGKNYKKGKKGGRKTKNPSNIFDTSAGQYLYAQVISKLGHNRLAVKLQTGQEVQAVIPGRFMKKVWINKEDYIVVQCIDDKFYDVIQKVTTAEITSKANQEMGAKVDKDDKDLYNPFNQKIDSDEENEENEKLKNNDIEDNIEENIQDNMNKLEDLEDLEEQIEQASENSENYDNSESEESDKEIEPETMRVSAKYLQRKQQNKANDIAKRNRTRVFTDKNILEEENKNISSNSDTEEEEKEVKEEKEVNIISKIKEQPKKKIKKIKLDINELFGNTNKQLSKPVNKIQNTSNLQTHNKLTQTKPTTYIMTEEEKNKEILDFMS